jgi:PIN domain nuclease of toxin-antitoxin system
MKYIFFTLFGLLTIQFSISAQTLYDQIDYSYDLTGNRINRSIPTIVVFKRGKFESAFEKNPENVLSKNSKKFGISSIDRHSLTSSKISKLKIYRK